MAEHDKKRYQFSAYLRAAAASAVLLRLPPDQRAEVLSNLDAAASISFPVEKKDRKLSDRSSVLGDVHELLCSLDPNYLDTWDLNDKTRHSARTTIKFWFVRVFSAEDRSVDDCPRASKQIVGNDLSEQQWRELCDILLQERYEDVDHNMRRFPCLEDYRDWLSAEIRRTGHAHHRQQLVSLDTAFKQSRAKSWQALLDRVAERFGLVCVKEKFKTERNLYAAQETCKRLLGETPMLDLYRTKVRTKKTVLKRHILKRKVAEMEEESSHQPSHTAEQFFQKEWFQVSLSYTSVLL